MRSQEVLGFGDFINYFVFLGTPNEKQIQNLTDSLMKEPLCIDGRLPPGWYRKVIKRKCGKRYTHKIFLFIMSVYGLGNAIIYSLAIFLMKLVLDKTCFH